MINCYKVITFPSFKLLRPRKQSPPFAKAYYRQPWTD